VPWAIAVNGFASVIGSLLSLPFAILFGFKALFAIGVAVYLLGCLAFARLPRAPGPAA
jgi:MFS family permease